ncbi:hypothetical protein [Modestobacter versicolor]|uniref:hypothetical protein n=1 Tax=Modestobacter versicolor TaxID=429133 RepID=UPI0034DE2873
MADVGRERRPFLVAIALSAYGLTVAQTFAAGKSLGTGDGWDWGRFWGIFFLVLSSSAVSSGMQALVRRGIFGSVSAQARRQYDDEEESAEAVRTGLLPPNGDADRWRIRIRSHVRRGIVLWTCWAALCAAAAMSTAAAAHWNNSDDPVLWTLAALALLLVIALLGLVRRDRRRGQRLLMHL